jgi:hypothetical protein
MNTLPVPHNRFPWVAVAPVAAIVDVAFAPTYYIKYSFDSPPLTVLEHVHGVIATAWIALHIAQARLIAVHKRGTPPAARCVHGVRRAMLVVEAL